MKIFFNKYEGTGNDFIIIDNRKAPFVSLDKDNINFLCDRRFGIGADGLILIRNHPDCDFEMEYYNSDGALATMCGNGGRSVSAWAIANGFSPEKITFKAADGIHSSHGNNGTISLTMNDVKGIRKVLKGWYLNTGSPHYVEFVDDPATIDVVKRGRDIRYNPAFGDEGTNVNFVSVKANTITVRTYERGVEDETLSCGTGVTASAIASVVSGQIGMPPVSVITKGGSLSVRFSVAADVIENIVLSGPAKFVFSGHITI